MKRKSRGSNEAVFERYRTRFGRYLDEQPSRVDLKILENSEMPILGCLGEWSIRYNDRREAIQQMEDGVAHHALRAMYFARDAALQGDPGWDHETRSLVERVYQNSNYHQRLEDSPEQIHSYGPSFRRLYLERRLAGDSHKEVRNSIVQWAHHRPIAWEEEDQRKQSGLDYANDDLAKHLTRKLSWRNTGEVEYPYATEVAGSTWRICLNDFPDDILYTLIIDNSVVGKFHDWPKRWQHV